MAWPAWPVVVGPRMPSGFGRQACEGRDWARTGTAYDRLCQVSAAPRLATCRAMEESGPRLPAPRRHALHCVTRRATTFPTEVDEGCLAPGGTPPRPSPHRAPRLCMVGISQSGPPWPRCDSQCIRCLGRCEVARPSPGPGRGATATDRGAIPAHSWGPRRRGTPWPHAALAATGQGRNAAPCGAMRAARVARGPARSGGTLRRSARFRWGASPRWA